MRHLLSALAMLLVLAVSPARADAPPAEEPKPLTPEQAADAVLEAVKVKDDAALKALAEKDEPDPWLVADELCFRGEGGAAAAFGRAAPRKAIEALPAFVEVRRTARPDTAGREALTAIVAALERGDANAALEVTTSDVDPGTVAGIRVAYARALALSALRRWEEAAEAFEAVADPALALGWPARAAEALQQAGVAAYRGADLERALAVWRRRLEVSETLGDLRAVALVLGNVGALQERLGRYDDALATIERSLALKRALGDTQLLATALYNLGVARWRTGDHQAALEALEEALRLREAQPDLAGRASVHEQVGLVLGSRGQHTPALASLRRALEFRETVGDRAELLRTLNNVSVALQRLGLHAEALPLVRRALEIAEERGDAKTIALLLGTLGSAQQAVGEYRQALESYRRGLAVRESRGDLRGIANALNGIGLSHAGLGEREQAHAAYERSLEVAERAGDRQGAARTHGNRGMLLAKEGRYREAVESYRRSLALKRALGDTEGQKKTLNDISLALLSLGERSEALAASRESLDLAREQGDPQAEAYALNSIGLIQGKQSAFREALASYREALEVLEALGDLGAVGATLTNIGNIHKDLCEFPRALSCHHRALEIAEERGDRASVATVLTNIANVRWRSGAYADALAGHHRAADIYRDLGDREGTGSVLGNIGNVYETLGAYDEALANHREALEVAESMEAKGWICRALDNVGLAHWRLGEAEDAVRCYQRAFALAEEMGDERQQAGLLVAQGIVLKHLGRHAQALAACERSLVIAEELGDDECVCTAHAALGGLRARMGAPEEALAAYERALEALDAAVLPQFRAGILRDIAEVHLILGRHDEALARCREAVVVAERLGAALSDERGVPARDLWTSLFEVGMEAALDAGRIDDLAFFLESGRAARLRAAIGQREALSSAVVPEDLRRQQMATRLAEARAMAALRSAAREGSLPAVRDARKAYDAARDEVRAVVRRIQREAARGAALTHPPVDRIADMQGRLAPREALVLYGRTASRTFALVVQGKGARVVDLASPEEVEQAAADLDVSDPSVDPEPAIGALRRLVVAPLALGEDVTRVLVSPVGRLGYVPICLLMPERDLVYLPSGTTHGMLLAERGLRGTGVLALGDPQYAGVPAQSRDLHRGSAPTRLAPLPATRDEVRAVGDVLLLGADATEAGLRVALGGGGRDRWRALHLACHGLVDPDRPMLSSLAMTAGEEDDGFLTSLEILRLHVPADLVVLSACETGKGKIYKTEGIVGLTRAFMFAGSPRVICSLWKVDDEATQALMVKFYELWNPKDGSEGLPTASALKAAQEYVRTCEREVVDHAASQREGRTVRKLVRPWGHPYYWAAWVLWGLPD